MWSEAGRRTRFHLLPFCKPIIIEAMRLKIFFSVTLLAATSAWAGIVDSVRMSLSQSNFSAAESQLASYRSQRGIDAEYVEAYSWMARAALDAGQYDQASAYAKETKTLVLEQLKQRGLDAEPHLPMALGAAFEVQSQAWPPEGRKHRRWHCLSRRCARTEILLSTIAFRRT